MTQASSQVEQPCFSSCTQQQACGPVLPGDPTPVTLLTKQSIQAILPLHQREQNPSVICFFH